MKTPTIYDIKNKSNGKYFNNNTLKFLCLKLEDFKVIPTYLLNVYVTKAFSKIQGMLIAYWIYENGEFKRYASNSTLIGTNKIADSLEIY